MKKYLHLLLVVLLVAFDQLTKYLVRGAFADGSTLTLIPKTLCFLFHKNTGAVWGIMEDQRIFLILFTIVAFALLVFFYFKVPNEKRYLPLQYLLVFVAAGAIGNFIDRIFFGYVTDFIYFELIDFPVFNVADIYITVSVFLFAILGIFYYKEEDFEHFSLFKKKEK